GAAVRGDPDGVRDADGLVPVHAPHPRDQMEGHALLERPLVALVEGDDVALVPGGREGDAERVPGAGDQLGSHVVALDQGPGEPVHLGDAHPGLHEAAQLCQRVLHEVLGGAHRVRERPVDHGAHHRRVIPAITAAHLEEHVFAGADHAASQVEWPIIDRGPEATYGITAGNSPPARNIAAEIAAATSFSVAPAMAARCPATIPASPAYAAS